MAKLAVRLYLFDITTGNLLQKFIAPDGDTFDFFGFSVALTENKALIGSLLGDGNEEDSGSAYLFDLNTGNFIQELTAPDGATEEEFGSAIAIDGDKALISSRADGDNGLRSGSAYLFDLNTGNLLQKFTAPDGNSDDEFGFSVAIDGGKALIGARGDEDNGELSGSAYLFDITTGSLIQKFIAPDGVIEDEFGFSVALEGNNALIGSRFNFDNGKQSGSAYLFDITTGNLVEKFTDPNGGFNDEFGVSVAIDGSNILIGASGDEDNGEFSGSAYLFNTEPVPEPSTLFGIGLVLGLGNLSLKRKRKG